jgi:RNA polymerase sigma factor (sigma-70 family)
MMKLLSFDTTLSTDSQWLQQLQQNDAQALASLMEKYYQDLYNYAAKFTRDEGLIKDCIQEVFISLWQRRQTALTILSPRYYLLRAVKNKVLKALYRNDQKGYPFDLPDEYDFFQEFSIERILIEKQITEDKAEKLKRALSQLSKRQQEVIYLKFYQYLDQAQIAEQMDISRQSVYNLLHEAIQRIRSIWMAEPIPR